MDVSTWSWKWRAAGGVAITLFTPWCGLKLLQINLEVRENVESVLPFLVDWVRETYGFEDEDKDRRRHVARMSALYSEPQRFTVHDPTLPQQEGTPGVISGKSSLSDVAVLCPGVSESTLRHPATLTFADSDLTTENQDLRADGENDNDDGTRMLNSSSMVTTLNEVSSAWEVGVAHGDNSENSALDTVVLDVVRVRPLAPFGVSLQNKAK